MGQGGDGFFQAALASYALFAGDQATAADLAVVSAVVLLPWSMLGPVVGVVLDRWSRRQVLLASNAVRATVTLGTATAVALGAPDAAVYGGALIALGVNRLFLAGLSAALPHTVPTSVLTGANAVTPTAGTAAFVVGLGGAAVVAWALPGAVSREAGLLVAAAATYAVAGALALRIPRPLLGPDRSEGVPAPRVSHAVAGIGQALRHLRGRAWPAAALGAMSAMRLWFGLVTVSAVLTLRNTADSQSGAVSALAGFTAAMAVGFLAAAVAAPLLARRVGRGPALATGLAVAGAGAAVPATSTASPAWWAGGLLVGLGAQVTKVCVDAVVQAGVDDDVRGRVFALYDMAYNAAFVAAAGLAVLVLPASGRSVPVLLTCAVGLLVTGAGFVAATRCHPAPADVAGTG